MESFHFDLGNSTQGPIGYCARIKAKTPEHALEQLRLALERINRELAVPLDDDSQDDGEGGSIEYIEVYFNPDALTVNNIDDSEDDSEDDGTNGQDRESYSDTQDRESYSADPRD